MNSVMDQIQQQYSSKKILVMGLGIQGGGAGVAEFFAKLGANVTVTDLKTEQELSTSIERLKSYQITYRLGGHKEQDFIEADVIFKGPSVRWDHPLIMHALDHEVVVEMEASFFASYCKNQIIGITGTRGKSTTTQMIYEMIQKSGKNVYLGGNVRNTSTISLLEKITAEDLVVLELSSWQLSGFYKKRISPHIAVFTNFYPDHLNYYQTMEEYWLDKSAIFQNQSETDYLVVNEELKKKLGEVSSKIIYFDATSYNGELKISGSHNRANAGAAYQVGKILNIDENIIDESLKNFAGLPYRQEFRKEINGIKIYNDTTSTTPIATKTALETFVGQPITLILGGNSKQLPFDNLLSNLEKVKTIILLKGSFTDEILPFLDNGNISGPYDSLKEAFNKSMEQSKPGDIILFSPGATSFAQFKNEFDRGDSFNSVVDSYAQKT